METLMDQLRKLSDLRESGVITDQEHDTRRHQLVDNYVGMSSPTPEHTHRSSFCYLNPGGDDCPPPPPPIAGGAALVPLGLPAPRLAPYTPHPPACPSSSGCDPNPGAGPPRRGRCFPALNGPGTTVKVHPVPPGLLREDVAAVFAAFGPVASVVLKGGASSCAFVTFANPEAAGNAMARGSVLLGGVMATVTHGQRRRGSAPDAGPSNGIGLFNLPFSTTREELNSILSVYDGFRALKMVNRKDTGQFKGYAFAYFETVQHAARAKEHLAGLTLGDQRAVPSQKTWARYPPWSMMPKPWSADCCPSIADLDHIQQMRDLDFVGWELGHLPYCHYGSPAFDAGYFGAAAATP